MSVNSRLLSALPAALCAFSCHAADYRHIDSSYVVSYLKNLVHETGTNPVSEPIVGSDGNYYGVLPSGALHDAGAIYRMTPDGTFTLVHKFKGWDGAMPEGRLLQASDGMLYGTTYSGGAKSCGTVYRLSLANEFKVLHVFNCKGGGGNPAGGLIQGSDGRLYGTGQSGGARRSGVVFVLAHEGSYNVIASFDAPTTGGNPAGELVQTDEGGFLGIATTGGAHKGGTLYSVSPDGKVARQRTFTPDEELNAGLVLTPDHGAAYFTLGNGAVLSYSIPDGRVDRIATISFGAPTGGITLGPDGTQYFGYCASSSGSGCAYAFVPDGKVSYLTGTLKGVAAGRPSRDSAGAIIGATTTGGNANLGTIFALSAR